MQLQLKILLTATASINFASSHPVFKKLRLGAKWWTVLVNLTYLLTCLLTPWCRILFEKLIVTQLVKKNPAFL